MGRTKNHFNPLFPYGKRLASIFVTCSGGYFNPLFPYGKRRFGFHVQGRFGVISIHSSHTGRDHCPKETGSAGRHFNPLFPYGKRPVGAERRRKSSYFNPLFPYGKRLCNPGVGGCQRRISIHSSHTGRDLTYIMARSRPNAIFQSTLPIREETGETRRVQPPAAISIHSSHTGRDNDGMELARLEAISIHSSHTGRDGKGEGLSPHPRHFNPLFPYGKRHPAGPAPDVGRYFNPLFPYGKRHSSIRIHLTTRRFQSTLPIREETGRG